MAPSAQSLPYHNLNSSNDLNDNSCVVAGALLIEDLPSFFTEHNLERLFDNEKLQAKFDSIVDEYAERYFVPLYALTKSDNSLFLKYSQQSRANWRNAAIVPEALKAKIRRTVSGFIHQLFDVHISHPEVDSEPTSAQSNQETVELGLDWKQDNDIVPVLEMMSRFITRESFVEVFAENVWLHTMLLSRGMAPSGLLPQETLELHSIWKNEEIQERKQISIKFAERKISQILRQLLNCGNNSSVDLESTSTFVQNESLIPSAVPAMAEDAIDAKEAVEVLERRLIGQGLDKRCNDSYHYLVKCREGASRWVTYKMLNHTDLVREFKRKNKLVAHSKKSPKRLNLTYRS